MFKMHSVDSWQYCKKKNKKKNDFILWLVPMLVSPKALVHSIIGLFAFLSTCLLMGHYPLSL